MINLFVGGFQFEEAYKYLLENRCVIVDEQLKNVISEWDECVSRGLSRSKLDITELPWEGLGKQYYLLRLPPVPIKGYLTGEVIKL
jgi:hypothetical protein